MRTRAVLIRSIHTLRRSSARTAELPLYAHSDVAAPKFRPCANGQQTAGEVGKQIAGASVAAIAALVINGFWLHFSRIKRKLPRRQNRI